MQEQIDPQNLTDIIETKFIHKNLVYLNDTISNQERKKAYSIPILKKLLTTWKKIVSLNDMLYQSKFQTYWVKHRNGAIRQVEKAVVTIRN